MAHWQTRMFMNGRKPQRSTAWFSYQGARLEKNLAAAGRSPLTRMLSRVNLYRFRHVPKPVVYTRSGAPRSRAAL